MTTETCGGVCGARAALWCCGWLWSSGPGRRLFGGGGGLVVVCIVDAGSCSVRGPLVGGCGVPPFVRPPLSLVCGGGWGCVFVLAC